VQVVAFDPDDAAKLGLTNLDATMSSRGTADPGDAMDLIDAPNATAITAIQKGLLTSGVGENTVTITVDDDDGDPVAQAWVTIKNSGQTARVAAGGTDANGKMTAGLDDGSYKVIVATQLGYVTANPYTLTVSGTTALTCEVEAISITAPDDPAYCRIYIYGIESPGGGFPTGYLRVSQVHSPASSSSKAIVLADSTDRQCALNAAGYAYLDIIKASVVTIELDITGVELETKRRVTIPSTSTGNYVDLTES